MGPNGSGKSTLAYVLAGREGYEVTGGDVLWNGERSLDMEPDERAAKGVFLAFQYPMEIPGVATMTFLRTALNAVRKQARPERADHAGVPEARARQEAAELGVADEMLKRPLNVGFSGGEKKRMEILQMAVLEPTLCVLDETDSGLDIDAMRIVSEGVNKLRSTDRAMLVITHYQRLLNYIVPDKVHVMADGEDPQDRRQGAGAGAGEDRLRRVQEQGPRECLRAAGRHDRGIDKDQGRAGALPAASRLSPRSCRADAPWRRRARRRSARSPALGLPHRRVEQWKYTDLRERVARSPGPGGRRRRTRSAADIDARAGGARRRSTPFASCSSMASIAPSFRRTAEAAGLEIDVARRSAGRRRGRPMACSAHAPRQEAVIALNTAFMTDGAVVRVAARTRLRQAAAAGVRARRQGRAPRHHAQRHRASATARMRP